MAGLNVHHEALSHEPQSTPMLVVNDLREISIDAAIAPTQHLPILRNPARTRRS